MNDWARKLNKPWDLYSSPQNLHQNQNHIQGIERERERERDWKSKLKLISNEWLGKKTK